MNTFFDWSIVISIVGVLVVLTNIIVQVLKKVTWEKLPTNLLAVLVAMVLTVAAFFAYCQIKCIVVVWYMVAAAIVLGFMVAYAAMFGFDKLKEAILQMKQNNERDCPLVGLCRPARGHFLFALFCPL